MKLTEKQIQAMQEALCIDLVQILMEECHYDTATAFDVLYNSKTFEKLYNPSTGLYAQSAGYVYDFLEKELKTP